MLSAVLGPYRRLFRKVTRFREGAFRRVGGEVPSRRVQRIVEEIGDHVGIGPADLVGIVELIDHAFPFFFAVFGDDGLFPVVPLQVHAHAGGVGFGVELGADHVFGKADGHDGSFQWDMGAFLFDGEDLCAHVGSRCVIGLDDLVVAAVDGEEGVGQA